MFPRLKALLQSSEPVENDHNNPLYVEWMGSDVSWRLYFLQDKIGPISEHRDGFKHFRKRTWTTDADHDHCAGCWVTLSVQGASEFFEGPDPVHGGETRLCPVCFALYKSACEGILKIEVTNRNALSERQRDWE